MPTVMQVLEFLKPIIINFVSGIAIAYYGLWIFIRQKKISNVVDISKEALDHLAHLESVLRKLRDKKVCHSEEKSSCISRDDVAELQSCLNNLLNVLYLLQKDSMVQRRDEILDDLKELIKACLETLEYSYAFDSAVENENKIAEVFTILAPYMEYKSTARLSKVRRMLLKIYDISDEKIGMKD
jgi:hypothetical protein